MSNKKHTPGAWVFYNNPLSKNLEFAIMAKSSREAHTLIGFARSEEVDIDDEVEANAKLIAAAPELLEALIDLKYKFFDRICQKDGTFTKDEIEFRNKVIEAIKKATE